MGTEKSFTEGPVFRPLLGFAMPVLLALFLQAMYGGVDLLVVGQFASTADVSGVATGSMLMQTVTGLVTGLAMGVTVLVGQCVGRREPQEAGRVVEAGIVLFTLFSLALSLLLVCFSGALSGVMQAPAEAFSQTSDYIRVCGAGTLFIAAYNVLGAVFRGLGDSRMPLVTVAIACALNIGGDLLFVAVFSLGAAGAALATALSQGVSVALSLLLLRRKSLPFRLSRPRFDRERMGRILRLGSPVALQDLLVGISFLTIQSIVNSLGLIPSAGVGVAEKVCGFVMLVPSSFLQSMSAFTAQNIGAGKPERARRALVCGILSSLGAGAVIGWAAFFHGDVLSGLFTASAEVAAASHSYLRAYAIDCLLTSFLFCFIGYFNGRGKTLFVMVQGIFAAFCVRIPIAYFVSRIPGASLFQIGLATPASSLVQIVLCLLMMARVEARDRKERSDVSHPSGSGR